MVFLSRRPSYYVIREGRSIHIPSYYAIQGGLPAHLSLLPRPQGGSSRPCTFLSRHQGGSSPPTNALQSSRPRRTLSQCLPVQGPSSPHHQSISPSSRPPANHTTAAPPSGSSRSARPSGRSQGSQYWPPLPAVRNLVIPRCSHVMEMRPQLTLQTHPPPVSMGQQETPGRTNHLLDYEEFTLEFTHTMVILHIFFLLLCWKKERFFFFLLKTGVRFYSHAEC